MTESNSVYDFIKIYFFTRTQIFHKSSKKSSCHPQQRYETVQCMRYKEDPIKELYLRSSNDLLSKSFWNLIKILQKDFNKIDRQRSSDRFCALGRTWFWVPTLSSKRRFIPRPKAEKDLTQLESLKKSMQDLNTQFNTDLGVIVPRFLWESCKILRNFRRNEIL